MDLLVIGAAFLVVAVIVLIFLKSRKQKMYVFHVGAITDKPSHFEGQKFMLYGFVDPFYGKSVKIRGYGGVIKGKSGLLPPGGAVMEGVFSSGVFNVERIVREVPVNCEIEWVEPAAIRTKKETKR